MSWIWAALMPHPPVIVPEVGKGREKEAQATLKGAEALLEQLRNEKPGAAPDVLLVLSPHLPYVPGALFVNTARTVCGSLSRFGAPGARVSSPVPAEGLALLTLALQRAGIPWKGGEVPDITRDHGSIVPLYYLSRAFSGQTLPPLIMANPSGLAPEQALALGDCLRDVPGNLRWALLSSGDLSHRLTPEAPGGYSPDGAVFDQAVVEALRAGDPAPLLKLSPKVRENAGECGFRPVLSLLRLTREPLHVFSYEGPFGVGYCTALWRPEQGAARPPDTKGKGTADKNAAGKAPRISVSLQPGTAGSKGGHPYALLARRTVGALLRGEALPTAADAVGLWPQDGLWSPRKGCFVSIKNRDGSLRGCIGTFMPTRANLAEEIIGNAVSASTRDPRFPPMQAGELGGVRFSVDVLEAPELVREGMDLNPAVYGVIVSKDGRRGLLLPDLPGVDSVEQQLSIAAQKGGIRDLAGAEIYRFTVSRHKERENGEATP